MYMCFFIWLPNSVFSPQPHVEKRSSLNTFEHEIPLGLSLQSKYQESNPVLVLFEHVLSGNKRSGLIRKRVRVYSRSLDRSCWRSRDWIIVKHELAASMKGYYDCEWDEYKDSMIERRQKKEENPPSRFDQKATDWIIRASDVIIERK